MKSTTKWFKYAMLLLILAIPTASVQACSVCFGDPDSPMSKGVVAGVFVLFSIISSVMVTIVGTGLFWMHRSRMLAKTGVDNQSADQPTDQSVAN